MGHARAEILRPGREAFFKGIASKGCQNGPVPRQHAQDRTKPGAPQDRSQVLTQFRQGGQQTADLAAHHVALFRIGKVLEDLAKAEDAHGQHDELDAIRQHIKAEGHPLAARLHVGTDAGKQNPCDNHRQGLDQRAVGQNDRQHQAHDHQ